MVVNVSNKNDNKTKGKSGYVLCCLGGVLHFVCWKYSSDSLVSQLDRDNITNVSRISEVCCLGGKHTSMYKCFRNRST